MIVYWKLTKKLCWYEKKKEAWTQKKIIMSTASPDCHVARRLCKLKRFLTTLQQFAADISPEIGDQVRNLILSLVVSWFYETPLTHLKHQSNYFCKFRTRLWALKAFTRSFKSWPIFHWGRLSLTFWSRISGCCKTSWRICRA
jgi:hypothetical protein